MTKKNYSKIWHEKDFKEHIQEVGFGYYFGEGMGLKDLAKMYDLSPSYMRKLYKEMTGQIYTQTVKDWKKDGLFETEEEYQIVLHS